MEGFLLRYLAANGLVVADGLVDIYKGENNPLREGTKLPKNGMDQLKRILS